MSPDEKPCALPGCPNILRRNGLEPARFARLRFCSPRCGHQGQHRPGKPPATVCKAGVHDLTDPANVYTTPSTGRRRCLPCLRARDAQRATRPRSTRTPRPKQPRKPAPVSTASPAEQAPPWRPGGFSRDINPWVGARR